jgi:hypothetical protein
MPPIVVSANSTAKVSFFIVTPFFCGWSEAAKRQAEAARPACRPIQRRPAASKRRAFE